MELFVPGRICLFGEHSDWASNYRKINPKIYPGKAIAVGTSQGIYATVDKHDKLYFCNNEIEKEYDLNIEDLNRVAHSNDFLSYVCGTTSYMLSNYSVGGLSINITKMDLPIKAGLSSSAAICVLVVRAFNVLYNLNLSTQDEMECAYKGELNTLSKCGQLDQVCAYGGLPVVLSFNDKKDLEVSPIKVKKDIYLVIVNLNAKKDTVKILEDLHKCYPYAESHMKKMVQMVFGEYNYNYVNSAITCIENGDILSLGKLMIDYQDNFDYFVSWTSSELTAPVLHKLFNDEFIKQHCIGYKGMGSQGDGSAQLLVIDEVEQEKVVEYINSSTSFTAYASVICKTLEPVKAIIPIAGRGTRMKPVSDYLPKYFLPVMNEQNKLVPIISVLLNQLIDAGVEEVCLVIRPESYSQLETYLSNHKHNIKIEYRFQLESLGLGHAVSLCDSFIDNKPFLLLLGDTIYKSNCNENCIKQLLNYFDKNKDKNVIGMQFFNGDATKYGVMCGMYKNNILYISKFVEKPNHEQLKELTVNNKYCIPFGCYVIQPSVLKNICMGINNEMNITDAINIDKHQLVGLNIDGNSCDAGTPEEYVKAITFLSEG